MVVTTTYDSSDSIKAYAQELAHQFQAQYIERLQSSIPRIRIQYGIEDILVVGEKGLRYHPLEAEEVFFHPSTALIRLKRLLRGEPDVLLKLADIHPGDHVLDCTAGLASDAIVFAFAVGDRGQVTALESSKTIAFLVREGLSHYTSGLLEVDQAMRRIQLINIDHTLFLKDLPDKSYDIIYFDPMFRKPIDDSHSISPIRHFANDQSLTLLTIEEAKRVARRRVILKENRDSKEFERLGFQKISRSHTKVAYGVIEL
jgi:16S rRNA (guanine1516-N2)-methyltransferase